MNVRTPSAAGRYYPRDADLLSELLANYLLQAAPTNVIPKALVVPHAGYEFSGAVAAKAYRSLQNVAAAVKRVVLIGPNHKAMMEGGAVPAAEGFATPLGEVPVDRALCDKLSQLPFMIQSDRSHAGEHSLEVQLPFLQLCLLRFSVLPIVVGYITEEQMCTLLDICWGDAETLVVISSDLSQHHEYDLAKHLDQGTCESIVDEKSDLSLEQACGAMILNGFLRYCRKKQLSIELEGMVNTADVTGDTQDVSGYASFTAH